MPALFGGADGAAITRRLLSLGFPAAMLMVSGARAPPGTGACSRRPMGRAP
jgi:hypothetical protein